MKPIFAPLVLSIALIGCGGGSDSSKDLFSTWNEKDGDSVVDLQGVEFGVGTLYSFILEDGSQCNCNLSVLGEQSNGVYAVNSCFYVSGSSSSGDPGCDAFNHTGTFTKTSDTLTLCGPTDCDQYE